eukprot:11132211-Lingulodinium_polyedra.AAC.1
MLPWVKPKERPPGGNGRGAFPGAVGYLDGGCIWAGVAGGHRNYGRGRLEASERAGGEESAGNL